MPTATAKDKSPLLEDRHVLAAAVKCGAHSIVSD
jgi:hypothetical protein